MGGKVIPLAVDDRRVDEEEDRGAVLAFAVGSANDAAVVATDNRRR